MLLTKQVDTLHGQFVFNLIRIYELLEVYPSLPLIDMVTVEIREMENPKRLLLKRKMYDQMC